MVDISWFYIKHLNTNKAITSTYQDDGAGNPLTKSRVILAEPNFTDNQLWCWDNQQLRNKSTGLVLDIRKGKLRFMEDTEVCLYHKKPIEDSQNQLWAVQTEEAQPSEHPLGKRRSSPLGSIIHSVANDDWVLDVCPEGQKLILFPFDHNLNQEQRWIFILENEKDTPTNNDTPSSLLDNNKINNNSASLYEGYYTGNISSRSSSLNSTDLTEFACGLSPAKRCSSQSSRTPSRKNSSI